LFQIMTKTKQQRVFLSEENIPADGGMIAAARTEIARCAAITGARVSMPQTQKRRLQKETAFCVSNIV